MSYYRLFRKGKEFWNSVLFVGDEDEEVALDMAAALTAQCGPLHCIVFVLTDQERVWEKLSIKNPKWPIKIPDKARIARFKDRKPTDYILPFGEFKGKQFSTVATTEEGREYLKWLAKQGKIKDRIDYSAIAFNLSGYKTKKPTRVKPKTRVYPKGPRPIYPIDTRLKSMGKDRKWLAKKLRISEGTLGKIIRERNYWGNLRRGDYICELLGVGSHFLLGWSSDLKQNAPAEVITKPAPTPEELAQEAILLKRIAILSEKGKELILLLKTNEELDENGIALLNIIGAVYTNTTRRKFKKMATQAGISEEDFNILYELVDREDQKGTFDQFWGNEIIK